MPDFYEEDPEISALAATKNWMDLTEAADSSCPHSTTLAVISDGFGNSPTCMDWFMRGLELADMLYGEGLSKALAVSCGPMLLFFVGQKAEILERISELPDREPEASENGQPNPNEEEV